MSRQKLFQAVICFPSISGLRRPLIATLAGSRFGEHGRHRTCNEQGQNGFTFNTLAFVEHSIVYHVLSQCLRLPLSPRAPFASILLRAGRAARLSVLGEVSYSNRSHSGLVAGAGLEPATFGL